MKGPGSFGKSEQIDGHVSEDGHVVTSAGMLDAATVLLPQSITYPVQSILDAPMTTPELQKLRSIGLPTRKTGDGVLHFGRLLVIAPSGSLKTNHLLQTGPAGKKGNDTCAGLKMPRDNPPMLFVVGACFAQIPIRFTLSGGGKMSV